MGRALVCNRQRVVGCAARTVRVERMLRGVSPRAVGLVCCALRIAAVDRCGIGALEFADTLADGSLLGTLLRRSFC